MRILYGMLVVLLVPGASWGLSIEDAIRQWSQQVPLAGGDARILLDVTLTSSGAATGAGFTLAGTGHVFDADGFNGNGTGYLQMSNWASSSVMANTGTVYLEFDRQAVTWSSANNGASAFSASDGIDTGAARYLFRAYNDAFTEEIRFFLENGSDDLPRFMYETTALSTITTLGRINSHAPSTLPSGTSTIVITWSGLDYWLYYDGHLFLHKTNTASGDALRFDNFRIADGLGNAHVKRIQLSSAFITPKMLNRKVAIYGDSFALAAIEGNSAGADTVQAIDAVQTHVGMPDRLANYIKGRAQSSWGHWLQALAYHDLRVAFPMYVSAKNGTGYSVTPRAAAYRDAINTFQPEVVIAMQSVNDVNPSSPVSNIVSATQAEMDTLIDGNPNLRKILFVTGISGHRDPTKLSTSGWVDEYERLTGLLNVGMNAYRGKVQVIEAYTAWGGREYPVTQTIGSHPQNATTSAGNDVHPTEVGHVRIAEIIWPFLKPYLTMRYRRD
jgi:hypothetical protein